MSFRIWEPLKSRGPSHRYCAGEDVAASSPSHPFASGLLWGQQPADLGPGAAGSADYHGLCVKPAVCRFDLGTYWGQLRLQGRPEATSKGRGGSVPQASRRTPSLRPPVSGGDLWSKEPWCPSAVQAEATGAGGEKRRGLSGRLSPGNVLWEDEQNFRGTTGLSLSLGSAGGSRDRYFLVGILVPAAPWVSTRGLHAQVFLPGSLVGSSNSVAPQLSALPISRWRRQGAGGGAGGRGPGGRGAAAAARSRHL